MPTAAYARNTHRRLAEAKPGHWCSRCTWYDHQKMQTTRYIAGSLSLFPRLHGRGGPGSLLTSVESSLVSEIFRNLLVGVSGVSLEYITRSLSLRSVSHNIFLNRQHTASMLCACHCIGPYRRRPAASTHQGSPLHCVYFAWLSP